MVGLAVSSGNSNQERRVKHMTALSEFLALQQGDWLIPLHPSCPDQTTVTTGNMPPSVPSRVGNRISSRHAISNSNLCFAGQCHFGLQGKATASTLSIMALSPPFTFAQVYQSTTTTTTTTSGTWNTDHHPDSSKKDSGKNKARVLLLVLSHPWTGKEWVFCLQHEWIRSLSLQPSAALFPAYTKGGKRKRRISPEAVDAAFQTASSAYPILPPPSCVFVVGPPGTTDHPRQPCDKKAMLCMILSPVKSSKMPHWQDAAFYMESCVSRMFEWMRSQPTARPPPRASETNLFQIKGVLYCTECMPSHSPLPITSRGNHKASMTSPYIQWQLFMHSCRAFARGPSVPLLERMTTQYLAHRSCQPPILLLPESRNERENDRIQAEMNALLMNPVPSVAAIERLMERAKAAIYEDLVERVFYPSSCPLPA